MGKLFAAYDLGLNALMVRYTMRYISRFYRDLAADDRSVNKCLEWFTDDLMLLADYLPKKAVRDLFQLATHLNTLLSNNRLGSHGLRSGMPDDFGTPETNELWRKLLSMSKNTLKHSPRLVPWFRFGKAMAFCYLNLLNQERSRVLPGLPDVIRTARRLSQHHIGATQTLKRLATIRPDQAVSDPIAVLNTVLRKKKHVLDVSTPNVAVIHKVKELNRRLQREITRLPDIQILKILLDDPSHPLAVLNAKTFPLTLNQARILRFCLRGKGKFISSSQMRRKQRSLESANIGREIERLPQPIKNSIQGQKGHRGGFRWIG